jgi:hypothetical protein
MSPGRGIRYWLALVVAVAAASIAGAVFPAAAGASRSTITPQGAVNCHGETGYINFRPRLALGSHRPTEVHVWADWTGCSLNGVSPATTVRVRGTLTGMQDGQCWNSTRPAAVSGSLEVKYAVPPGSPKVTPTILTSGSLRWDTSGQAYMEFTSLTGSYSTYNTVPNVALFYDFIAPSACGRTWGMLAQMNFAVSG